MKVYVSPAGDIDMAPQPRIACVSFLMDARNTAVCGRFKGLTARLLERQLRGDDLAGRVLWVLSHGTRFMAIDVGRKLLASWSVD